MSAFKNLFASLALTAAGSFAQTPSIPTTPDLPCQANPGTEEVAIPDTAGYVKIFNGEDLKGWWQDCATEDSERNRTTGAVIKYDPVSKSMFTNQRGRGEGGMLTSNKTFGNHEIIIEYYANWGNDAGLFHMTQKDGSAFQTVIDYYDGGECVGGSYPQHQEDAIGFFYKCSYFFNGATNIKKGNATFPGIDWTTMKAADIIDQTGWNQLRVKIFSKPNQPPHHQSWVKSAKATTETKVLDVVWPAKAGTVPLTGFIGFQVHGIFGNSSPWSDKGNWYRNIRIRPLDGDGNPILVKVEDSKPRLGANFSATAAGLSGWLDKDYEITVRDITGRSLETFQGITGSFNRSFGKGIPKGMLLVELKSGSEKKTIRVAPI